MRILYFLFILSLLPIGYVNAQQFNQQENKPQWGGMSNPRARRARPANQQDEAKKPVNKQPQATTPNSINQPAKNATANTTKTTGNEKFKKAPSNLPALTDGMAERIAQMKGKSLTWADYEMYPYEEDKTGYYMRIYQLNEGMTMNIGGPSPDYEPRYIYITDGKGNIIKALKEY